MTTKAKGSSVRQKITDLSNKINIPFQNIQTAFMIERLVARLVTDKNLAKHLVFKGGFVGLRVYNSERYTVDLDALLVNADIESSLALTRKNAESDLDDGVWFKFVGQMDLVTQGEYGGIRQVYRAGIGETLTNIKKAQIVHFDLGIGDPITLLVDLRLVLLEAKPLELDPGELLRPRCRLTIVVDAEVEMLPCPEARVSHIAQ